ncbi:MAG: dienelactone hydrolase family protein [Dehalococcoidia bacterium]|nr:dienelactone hydrolase family protein [Dehalococcoidia bacterium]
MFTTDQYHGMLAETVTVNGANGDAIHAYLARPLGAGPFPAVVLIHHMPGWDEFYFEMTRKFAHHGYLAISPDLYCRDAHGAPDDVAAKVRADGGAPDARVVEDVAGAARYVRSLPNASGKVGVIGSCSGGRHTYLAVCQTSEFDAAVDLWGGRVVMRPDELNERTPVAPIDLTKDLSCPLLGLFGAEDRSPTAEQVAQHEAALKEHGKDYEFHMYEGAGHGFFYYHSGMYRQEAAVDGWEKVWAFFAKHLGGPA